MSKQEKYDYNDKLSFLAEWFDYESAFYKKFLMNYFLCDGTVELFDRENNRIYLKRAMSEKIQIKDLFIGNEVRIYGRQILITDYADNHTAKFIGKTQEHTFAIIKPSILEKVGEIIPQIENNKFLIAKLRMCILSRDKATEFYEDKRGDAFLPFMLDAITSGPLIALELVGYDAIERWRIMMGPTDPLDARKSAPTSMRALYGLEKATNGFHGSDNCEKAMRESDFFFGRINNCKITAQLTHNCTCCVIKPHAIEEGKLGYILSAIINSAKFKITAMRMFFLSNANANEFLEVYKGVVSDFHALLLSFLDGPCVALEVSGKNSDVTDVHGEFRKFVGPSDSDIARQIRPESLRGKFGIDKYKNAVHCTDLQEDTLLELEYFFRILDN